MAEVTQKGLTGRTISILSRALDYRSRNHQVIAANLANIDTPGYRPKALSFEEAFGRALDRTSMPLKTTHSKHFSRFGGGLGDGETAFRLKTESASFGDSNQLNIDREMSKMVQNNLLYESSVKLLSKKFEALKSAIEGGRR